MYFTISYKYSQKRQMYFCSFRSLRVLLNKLFEVRFFDVENKHRTEQIFYKSPQIKKIPEN